MLDRSSLPKAFGINKQSATILEGISRIYELMVKGGFAIDIAATSCLNLLNEHGDNPEVHITLLDVTNAKIQAPKPKLSVGQNKYTHYTDDEIEVVLALVSNAINCFGSNSTMYSERAALYKRLGKMDSARQDIVSSLALEKNYQDFKKEYCTIIEGYLAKAAKRNPNIRPSPDLYQLIHSQPDHPYALACHRSFMAKCACADKRYELAEYYYDAALTLTQDNFLIVTRRSQAHSLLQQYQKAFEALNYVIRTYEYTPAYYMRGLEHYRSKNLLMAKADFLQSIKDASGNSFDVLDSVKDLVLHALNGDDANTDMNKVTSDDTSKAQAFIHMARKCIEKGRYDEAEIIVEKIVRLDAHLAGIYDLRADIYEAHGDINSAINQHAICSWLTRQEPAKQAYHEARRRGFEVIQAFKEVRSEQTEAKQTIATPQKPHTFVLPAYPTPDEKIKKAKRKSKKPAFLNTAEASSHRKVTEMINYKPLVEDKAEPALLPQIDERKQIANILAADQDRQTKRREARAQLALQKNAKSKQKQLDAVTSADSFSPSYTPAPANFFSTATETKPVEPELKHYKMFAVEAIFFNYVEKYNKEHNTHYTLYVGGGSIYGRAQAQYFNETFHFSGDIDFITDLPKDALLNFPVPYNPTPCEKKPNLYRLKTYDPEIGNVKIDFFHEADVSTLYKIVRSRDSGYILGDKHGNLLDGTGFEFYYLRFRRLVPTIPREVIYKDNPCRMLRHIKTELKHNVKLDRPYHKQMQHDKACLLDVSLDEINYKLSQLFEDGRALQAYKRLTELGFMRLLFPGFTKSLFRHAQWLEGQFKEMNAIPKPSLARIYANFVLLAAFDMLNLNANEISLADLPRVLTVAIALVKDHKLINNCVESTYAWKKTTLEFLIHQSLQTWLETPAPKPDLQRATPVAEAIHPDVVSPRLTMRR